MLHTPRSTCRAFTLLELGMLPIRQEIDLRKLNFLHHILTLPSDDPVICVYNEQKLYTNEPNWYNEIVELLKYYSIIDDEETIKSMSKDRWKNITKQAIRTKTLTILNEECRSKSKTANVPVYEELAQQEYFLQLTPRRARTYFQIRANVYDIKCNRKYMYSDEICRLCNVELENMDHILNHCSMLSRGNAVIEDIYDMSEPNVSELIRRVEQFKEELEQKEELSSVGLSANLSHTNPQE